MALKGHPELELQRREWELKSSEERYRRLTEAVADYIFTVHVKDGLAVSTYHGAACIAVTGYTSEELEADPFLWINMVHDEDRPAVREQAKLLLAGRKAEALEHRIRRKDGEIRWVRNTPVQHYDEKKNLVSYDGLIRDITAQKLAEAELKRANKEWQGIFQAIGQPTFILSPQQDILSANRAAVNLLNMSEEELQGFKCYEVFHNSCNSPEACPLSKMWESGSQETSDEPVEALGRLFIVSCTPLYDDQGRIEKILHLATDITELTRTTEALCATEDKYRSIFENAVEGIFQSTADGRYLSVNPAFAHMFGYDSAEEIIGEISDIRNQLYAHPENRDHIVELLQLGRIVKDYECEFVNRQGEPLWVSINARAVRNPEGDVVYLEGTTVDITPRKKAERERQILQAQLMQSQRLESVGRLAGGVAHDFNNLLTPILGYAEMIKSDLPPGDRGHKHIEHIRHAAELAKDLVRQLLAFSRKQVLELRTIDLVDTVLRFEKLLRRTIREDIQIEINLPEKEVFIHGDIGQIEQVIMNLAVNAQDAMPKGGKLIINVSDHEMDPAFIQQNPGFKPGRYVLLSVSDTGNGMDDITRERIYEPFFTTKEVGKGTGLGLSIVYGIISQHGGIIQVVSEAQQGTTFNIYLPCVADEENSAVEDTESVLQPRAGTETILVVEDDAMLRELTCQMLMRSGYQILSAENGFAGFELVKHYRKPIHLLLADVVMPGLNGKELYERTLSRFPNIKVLFMSGYANDILTENGFSIQGLNFIPKPFTQKVLLDKVMEVLKSPKGK